LETQKNETEKLNLQF